MKPYKATGELQLFRAYWMLSNRRSWLSDLPLREFSINYCAHMLNKKQFSHFRLYLGNLRLLSTLEHNLLDQNTEERRISYSEEVNNVSWDKIYTLQDELRVLYADTFPKKVGPMIMKYSQEEVSEKIASLNRSYLDTLDWIPTEEKERVLRILISGEVQKR